jgi:hypothetical protein
LVTDRRRDRWQAKARLSTGSIRPAVEADETLIGRSHKSSVLAPVERGGRVKCVHIDSVTGEDVAREAWLMTDEGRHYRQVGTELAGHGRVHHTRGE